MAQFGSYIENGSIIRASDGAVIPADPANRDYRAAMTAVAAGDTIAPYQAPPPVDLSTLDMDTLNSALAQPGSVVRSLALVVFDLATGKIPINPNYTQAQFVALLKAKMR